MFFATDTYFFAKLLVILFCGTVMSGMPGGLTEQKVANNEIQKICNDIKPEAQTLTNKSFSSFTAVSYKTQVVRGTMYYIKIDVGDNKYIHAKVYKDLPYTDSGYVLQNVQVDKSRDDPINYF